MLDHPNNFSAHIGYPAISVPLGYYPANTSVVYNSRNTLVSSYPRRPFGLTFIGRRFSEEKLVALACAFEAATQVRAAGQQYFVSIHVKGSFELRYGVLTVVCRFRRSRSVMSRILCRFEVV